MRVAIPKIYFPLDPQDDMDGYLKNTEKMATLTLRILDREQKINHYLKTFANQLGGYVLAFYQLYLSSATEPDWKTGDTATVTILLTIS